MTARALMVLGTSSSAGKSLLAAGICRCLRRAGVNVAPFKAQNMSNNAAVTIDGGEIGRAQALQARACGLPPHSDMNPVLLKPSGPRRMQVVVQGKVFAQCDAAGYHELANELWPSVIESYGRLAASHDVIVLEGAGSCAELNIAWDFTNLKMARHSGADCLLIGDIDRGGIFAQLIGTLALLSDEDRARVRGTVINRFRGDRDLLATAVSIIEERTGVPVLGILPFMDGLVLDEEDSLGIPSTVRPRTSATIAVDVLCLPHISNFTDFAPLAAEPDVSVRYVDVIRGESLDGADVVVIPGSKNTIDDLEVLRSRGYLEQIIERHRDGAEIVGICGGLQMLGHRIEDPYGVESASGGVSGLGLLPIETSLLKEKTTRVTSGRDRGLGVSFHGYEIHSGESRGDSVETPMLDEDGRAIGFGDERAWGTYVHGIFDGDEFRHAWLRRCRARKGLAPDGVARVPYRPDQDLDRVADTILDELRLPSPWADLIGASSIAARR